jgi:uncharacterized protein with GYD domain
MPEMHCPRVVRAATSHIHGYSRHRAPSPAVVPGSPADPTRLPAVLSRRWGALPYLREDAMPLFIVTINWTDQGIKAIKDAPKRAQASRDLAKSMGVEITQIYLTSGESDLLAIVDAPSGDNVAKLAMALGAQGNIRTKTVRAWTEGEFSKFVSELP